MCSCVGHFSPLLGETLSLEQGDLVKMYDSCGFQMPCVCQVHALIYVIRPGNACYQGEGMPLYGFVHPNKVSFLPAAVWQLQF